MDAFHNTTLEKKLRELQADTLLVTGVATNFCVETTVRSAFNRGYKTVALSDCVATINQESRDLFLNVIYPMLGKVSTVGELTFSS
jgi:nicotinamidase-related amidase